MVLGIPAGALLVWLRPGTPPDDAAVAAGVLAASVTLVSLFMNFLIECLPPSWSVGTSERKGVTPLDMVLAVAVGSSLLVVVPAILTTPVFALLGMWWALIGALVLAALGLAVAVSAFVLVLAGWAVVREPGQPQQPLSLWLAQRALRAWSPLHRLRPLHAAL
jgi:hypothetical protein